MGLDRLPPLVAHGIMSSLRVAASTEYDFAVIDTPRHCCFAGRRQRDAGEVWRVMRACSLIARGDDILADIGADIEALMASRRRRCRVILGNRMSTALMVHLGHARIRCLCSRGRRGQEAAEVLILAFSGSALLSGAHSVGRAAIGDGSRYDGASFAIRRFIWAVVAVAPTRELSLKWRRCRRLPRDSCRLRQFRGGRALDEDDIFAGYAIAMTSRRAQQ